MGNTEELTGIESDERNVGHPPIQKTRHDLPDLASVLDISKSRLPNLRVGIVA